MERRWKFLDYAQQEDEMFALIGLVMWSGHCAAKYLCK
nr:MAG TPA: formylglycinamide ribonucleotide amidotransferase [Caudoviricetes sp.]DAU01971.1 MAG TPA: formylglycinamide ribonucleotide amidotransferase [Caudoviricetes sp.]